MYRRRFSGWQTLLLLSASLALAACRDSSDSLTGPAEGELAGIAILDATAPLPAVTLQLQRPGQTLSTFSDDVGQYSFKSVASGEWQLVIGLPAGYDLPSGHAYQRTVDVPAGGRTTVNIAVVNSNGYGSIIAQVFADSLFPDGNQFLPVAGVTVRAFDSGGTDPIAETTSGDNGLAIIAVPEGEYDVAVVPGNGWEMAPGSEERVNGLTVTSGESQRVEFRVQQTGGGGGPILGTIAGTALLHDLDPIAGLEATLQRSDFVMIDVTGQGGSFSFTGLEPGEWLLSVTPPEEYRLAADEPNPRTIVISDTDLYHRVNISLTTVDGTGALLVEARSELPTAQDSLGVQDVVVRLFEAGGSTAIETATTGYAGRAIFRLVPGNYDAEIVVPAGYELASGESSRRNGLTVREGHNTVALFRLIGPSD